MKRLLTTTALVASGLAFAAPATAQSDAPVDLGLLILSGGLTPIFDANLQRSFTTVTSEEIAQKGFGNVLDALRTVPGFAPSAGGLNEFRIRGAQANHALVLVDGVEVGLGSSGSFDLGNLPIGDVERIEVLRGPQSAAFGANAASGVINIVTRGASDAIGNSGRISLDFADNGGHNIGLSLATRGERGFIALNFASTDDGGYDISNDEDGDLDTQRASAITLKGGIDVTEALSLGVTLREQTRSGEFDSTRFPFGPDNDKEDYVVDGNGTSQDDSLSGEVFATLDLMEGRLRQRLGYSALDQQQEFGPFPSNSENKRDKWSYTATYGLDGAVDTASQAVILALEEEWEAYVNHGFFAAEEDRITTSAALEYRGSYSNGLDVQLGIRQDRNNAFEDAVSWNGALGYAVTADTTLRASGGKGIVNPTMIEQFGVFSFFRPFRGNPDLTPETVTGWDLGVDHTFRDGLGTVSLTYFEQQINDRIASAVETEGGIEFDTLVNDEGTSTQQGVELSLAYQATETLSFDGAYSYLHARDADDEATTRVPEHVFNLGARLVTFNGRGDLWAQLNHVSGIVDLDRRDFTRTELEAYTLINVGASYAIFENGELFGRIENLTGATYEEQWGYDRDDTRIVVGFRTAF